MSAIQGAAVIPPVAVRMVQKNALEALLTGPGMKEVALPSGTVRAGAGSQGLGGRREEEVVVAQLDVGGGDALGACVGAGGVEDDDDGAGSEALDYEEDDVAEDGGGAVGMDTKQSAGGVIEGDGVVVDRELLCEDQVVVAFHVLPHSAFPGLCLALIWHPGGRRKHVIVRDRAIVTCYEDGLGRALRRRRPLFLLDDGVEAEALELWAGGSEDFASWGRLPSPLSSSSSFDNPAWPVFQRRSPWCPDAVVVAVREKVVALQESVLSLEELKDYVADAVQEEEMGFRKRLREEDELNRAVRVSPAYWGCLPKAVLLSGTAQQQQQLQLPAVIPLSGMAQQHLLPVIPLHGMAQHQQLPVIPLHGIAQQQQQQQQAIPHSGMALQQQPSPPIQQQQQLPSPPLQ